MCRDKEAADGKLTCLCEFELPVKTGTEWICLCYWVQSEGHGQVTLPVYKFVSLLATVLSLCSALKRETKALERRRNWKLTSSRRGCTAHWTFKLKKSEKTNMFTQQRHTTEMCFYCQGKIKKFQGDIYVFLSNNKLVTTSGSVFLIVTMHLRGLKKAWIKGGDEDNSWKGTS